MYTRQLEMLRDGTLKTYHNAADTTEETIDRITMHRDELETMIQKYDPERK